MTFPILVEPSGAQFAAVLVGAPDVRVVGSTREAYRRRDAEIRE